MKEHTRWFCHLVIQLDRFPRYGRVYKAARKPEGGWTLQPARWMWQKRGRWGMNLLGRMGLLWPYLDSIMGPVYIKVPATEEEKDAENSQDR